MEQKNLLIAAVLSIGILLVWQFMYEQPRIERARLAAEQKKAESIAQGTTGVTPMPGTTVPGAGIDPVPDLPTAVRQGRSGHSDHHHA